MMLVVHHPPSLSLDNFLTDLLQIIQSIFMSVSNVPSVILGDFDEDINSSQYVRIQHSFYTFAFTQKVQKPTTVHNR